LVTDTEFEGLAVEVRHSLTDFLYLSLTGRQTLFVEALFLDAP